MKNCSDSFRYEYNSKKYCVSSCDFFQHTKLYNYINNNGDNECVEICKNLGKENYKFSRVDGFCGNDCTNENGNVELYHEEENFICLPSCPKKYFHEENSKVCKKCSKGNFYEDKDGNCLARCSDSENGYIYTDEQNHKCLDKCSTNFIQDYVCVDSCDGDHSYIYDNYCVDACPISRNYYDSRITSVKTCLSSCPNDLSYYKKISVGSKTHSECVASCKAYVLNVDPKNHASLCLGDSCTADYKYYYTIQNGAEEQKICSSQCPPEFPYYKEYY